MDFLQYWCYSSASTMEWNQIHQNLEKAYIQGDFTVVEKALESRMDLGVIFPCILLYDAVRIGRHRTVRLLLENYSDVVTDAKTLTSALRDVVRYHDVRLLCDWAYVDEHLREVTLRNAESDVAKRGHCPCERAKIIHSLIVNGARTDDVDSVLTDFLLTSPVLCPTSLACSLDMLLDHGCDLSPVLSRFVACNNLYRVSRQSLLTIVVSSSVQNKSIDAVLPILLYNEDEEAIEEIRRSGSVIGQHECRLALATHSALDINKIPNLKEITDCKAQPCSLASLSRTSIRSVLAKKRSELAEHKPKTMTTLIRGLDYPQTLKRYLAFDSFQWRRKDLE